MGWLNDIIDTHFTADQNRIDALTKNPGRILLPGGAKSATPLEASVTNAVFGSDQQPIVSQFGGETSADFARAESKGIDTRNDQTLSSIGDTIAGIGAASAGSGYLGGGGDGSEIAAADSSYVGDIPVDPNAGSYVGTGGNYVGDIPVDSAVGGTEGAGTLGDNSWMVALNDTGTTTDVTPGLTGGGADTTTGIPGIDTQTGEQIGQGWESDSAQAQGGDPSQPQQTNNPQAKPPQSTMTKTLEKYGVPLALLGASAAISGKKQQMPNQGQYQQLSAESQATADMLLKNYQNGTLTPGQQAQLDQMTANAKNQINNYYASIGQSGSTSHQQALAQADQQALATKGQLLATTLQQGLQAIGISLGPLNAIATWQMQQDKRLQDAYANFASSAARLYASSDTPSATPATAPAG